LGHRPVLAQEFDLAPVHPPLRSPPSVLQLVSERVRSLVVFNRTCDSMTTLRKGIFPRYASLLTLIGACTMAPSAYSRLSLSLGIEMCRIAIEDDKKRSGEMEVNHDDL
jgi:hypothetical protein